MAVRPIERSGQGSMPEGTVLEGRRPTPVAAPQALLKLPTSQDFLFLFHPSSYDVVEVDGAPAIVPRLRELRFEPGISGVEEVKGQRGGNPRRALANAAERGWTAIDPDIETIAWGKRRIGYVAVYDGHRGPVHLSVWHRPYIRGGQAVVDFDEEGWCAWRASLITSGVVPGPDRATLRELQMQMQRMLRKLQTSAEKSASARGHAEVYEQRLQVFQGGQRRPRAAAPEAAEPLPEVRPATRAPTPPPTPPPTPKPEVPVDQTPDLADDEQGVAVSTSKPAADPPPPTPKSVPKSVPKSGRGA